MDDEPVRVVPWREEWTASFEREAERLREAIGAWASGGIHHVGSTAVKGLAAKPVIDIMVGVESLEASRECLPLLAKIDYLYAPYRAEEMHWFCKPDPSRRTHHLHLVPSGSARFEAALRFRDRLRADSEMAREYEALKRELAERFVDDRDGYTQAKEPFIKMALSASS